MILEVKDTKTEKAFLRLPRKLYSNDREWIACLDEDVRAVFDPDRNNFFQHGACERWILTDENRDCIGRVAAFINYNNTESTTGGMGFFECINDHQAAHQLFDTAKHWLQSSGVKEMEGPVNFGENDKFWGLLVEGFKASSYGMNYNPDYYQELFESYGFEKKYDQYTNVLDVEKPMPERFTKISGRVLSNKEYRFESFCYSKKEKYFRDFQEIYNDAWHSFDHFHPIELDTIRESFRQMKQIMDEKIIWFAYHQDEPVAFIVCVPDANQILRHLKGRMHLMNKLRFVWYRKTANVNRIRIMVMGCKQKFQNHGIESAFIHCLQNEVLPRHTIKEVELSWVGDFNTKMLALHRATGAKKSKVHRTYRYAFD